MYALRLLRTQQRAVLQHVYPWTSVLVLIQRSMVYRTVVIARMTHAATRLAWLHHFRLAAHQLANQPSQAQLSTRPADL